MNHLAESVKLGHVLGRNDNALIFVDDNCGTCWSVKDNAVMLSCEENIQLCQLLGKLLKRCWERGEDEI